MTSDVSSLLDDLTGLIESLSFPLDLPSAEDGREDRDDLAHQLHDYILPRYQSLEAPLLAVIGGSTGSGKSALTNSLVGHVVSPSSAIRPTTRRPLLVHHPRDTQWFAHDRVLPGLARVTSDGATTDSHDEIALVAADALPQGLALLDSPDIDSVVEENRRLAAQLLAAADMWIFVTTAARYADAIPWALLDDAAQRNIVVGVVLNRVPPGVSADVRHDLSQRLESRGLSSAPLFVIPETQLHDSLIPADDIAGLRSWLAGIAHDSVARSTVARQTLRGALGDVIGRGHALIPALNEQRDALITLAEHIDDSFANAHARVMDHVADGSLLRGEVLARWQDFVGTGEILRTIEAGVGRIRDRLTSWFKGSAPERAEDVEEALEDGVATMVISHAESAIAAVQRTWARGLGGDVLVGRATAHLRDPAERQEAAIQLVRQWQAEILDMVREQGESKRTSARILALGVNTVGVALMVFIFATTAGLTGGEVVVAGSTAVVAQKLLEAIFGDEAVRAMAKRATDDLSRRVGQFLIDDAAPFRRELSSLGIRPGAGDDLHEVLTLLTNAMKSELS